MELFQYVVVIIAGLLAGFINTLAGNGSAITLPVLIMMGLPATVANGTNRIGVLMQTVVSTGAFARSGHLEAKTGWQLALPAAAGGLIGAAIAVDLDERSMRLAIGGMLVFSFFLALLQPERWLKGRAGGAHALGWREMGLFLLIGIYGGFIQAGVGIFLLVTLVLRLGHNLVRANALKAAFVLAANLVAFAIFIRNGQVAWGLGFLLASGQVVGAWVAAHMAVREWAQVWVYRLLLVIIAISAGQMFLT